MATTIDLRGVDLLELIGHDVELRRVAGTNGGEYAGPCPFCGGRDRFRVWPQDGDRGRFWCRQCDAKGDAIDYIRQRDNLGFSEALERLGSPVVASVARQPAAPPRLEPPTPSWQGRARSFVAECQAALWGDHAEGLAWMRKRGLADETIRAAGLGLNVRDRREDPATWGLDAEQRAAGGARAIWLPRGIVIPWEIGGELWRVNIRRPSGDVEKGGPKYIGPAGSRAGLYNADRLQADRPAMIVEGELDALTVQQLAGDLVAAVATGSTMGAHRAPWVARLAICSTVLVSFDTDEAGEKAAAWWLGVLDNAQRWRPFWGDANAMAQDGADVRSWVEAGLLPPPTADPEQAQAEPVERCAICGGELAAFGPCGLTLCERHADRCEGLGQRSGSLACAAEQVCPMMGK